MSTQKAQNKRRARKDKAQTHEAMVAQAQSRARKRVNAEYRFSPSLGTSGVALAKCIALPGETNGFRMPTTDAPRTSVMKGKDRTVISTPTEPTLALDGFNAGDLVVNFFGQPNRLHVTWTQWNGHNTATYYQLNFNNLSGISTAWLVTPVSVSQNMPIFSFWPVMSTNYLSGDKLYGDIQPVGHSKGNNYVFLNSKETLQVTAAATGTATGSFVLSVWKWVQPNTEDTLITEKPTQYTASGYTVFTATEPGYYALAVNNVDITTGALSSLNLTFQIMTPSSSLSSAGYPIAGWRHYGMADVNLSTGGDPSIVEDARIVGASILITNTTAPLYRQGNICAARMGSATYTGLTGQKLAVAGESYNGDAADGVYSFKEFTSYGDTFRNHSVNYSTTTGSTQGMLFDLEYTDYVHSIWISNPNYATAPNNFIVTCDTIVEFRTPSGRYQKDVSRFNYQQLIDARKHLNSTPIWFYENPLHMAQLYNFIKGGARALVRGVKKVAPVAGTVATALDPAGAPAYAALTELLRRM